MKRLALGLFVVLANLSVGRASLAQAPEEAASASDMAGGDKATPADTTAAPDTSAGADTAAGADIGAATEGGDLGDLTLPEPGEVKKAAEPTGAGRKSWDDIVVIPRKAFLKKYRLEVAPFAGITLNDPLIRHYSFGGDVNFYITDVLSIGLEGQYFIKELSQRESLVGLQYYLVPSLNKLKYHYALAFGYVPGYGKFGLFNKWIVHWDLTFALGLGMIRTEIIPRRAGDDSFTNDNIVGHVGMGVRLFLVDWLTFNVTFRDYIYSDVFEVLGRHSGGTSTDPDIATVKSMSQSSQSQLVQNIMVFVSIGLFIPPSFTYRTPR